MKRVRHKPKPTTYGAQESTLRAPPAKTIIYRVNTIARPGKSIGDSYDESLVVNTFVEARLWFDAREIVQAAFACESVTLIETRLTADKLPADALLWRRQRGVLVELHNRAHLLEAS